MENSEIRTDAFWNAARDTARGLLFAEFQSHVLEFGRRGPHFIAELQALKEGIPAALELGVALELAVDSAVRAWSAHEGDNAPV